MLLPEAGYCLSRYSYSIAEKTGLSTSLIGSMLLATVTPLPELVIVGLVFRPQGRAMLGLTCASLSLFLLYVLNTWILFEHGY